MKKYFALLLALLCLVMAVGCGGSPANDVTVDTEALMKDLTTKVAYPDDIYPTESSMADMLLTPDKLPEGAEASIYLNSLSNVRAMVVTCASAADAESFASVMKGFVERQKEVNASYAPEEVTRLDNAVLRQAGPYVVLVVCDDAAGAAEIVDGYLK